MSIFGTILQKIFHHDTAKQPAPSAPAVQPAPSAGVKRPIDPPAAAPAAAPAAPVDVEAVLRGMAQARGGGGNWQTSIVDLLKLLDLDSGLDARKQLADELQVHAGADGSAAENVALHKAVMRKLAENGGKVPASLTN